MARNDGQEWHETQYWLMRRQAKEAEEADATPATNPWFCKLGTHKPAKKAKPDARTKDMERTRSILFDPDPPIKVKGDL